MPRTMRDTSKLCIHTITTRPLSIEAAIEEYALIGARGISVWRESLDGRDPSRVGLQIKDAGLSAVSLCRGGFFPAAEATGRRAAIEDNQRAIDQAAQIGASMVVLVCGAVPKISLEESRRQILEGIETILPAAEDAQIRLAVEPLHPMYADSRSAINTLKQANDLIEMIQSPYLGVVVDVYHVWWDPDLEREIQRCGQANHLFAFHICDWKTPTTDLLNDRGLMGEGCIPISKIREWVEAAGFEGFHEVEIFSKHYWSMDQHVYLEQIKAAYLEHC
jgi:sugar phosphate isomerase/epimerase